LVVRFAPPAGVVPRKCFLVLCGVAAGALRSLIGLGRSHLKTSMNLRRAAGATEQSGALRENRILVHHRAVAFWTRGKAPIIRYPATESPRPTSATGCHMA